MGCKKMEIFSCQVDDKCTRAVEALIDCEGDCSIACCGQEMTKVTPKSADKTTEKHVPVIEKIDGGYKVTVGTTLHPMEEKHFIQFIELRSADSVYRKYLKPGDAPVAEFKIDADQVSALEYCNVHGFWSDC